MPVPEFPLSEQQRSGMFHALREALRHGVGYRRYAGDTYRGGGCWPLVGLWFALGAGEVLAAAEVGPFMRSALHEASASSTPLGYLPEQINPESSQPTWVVPLAWSHAFFMQLMHRNKKIEEAKKILDEPAFPH
jgi:GH15 family glucan-1,4-alpha-glucosidase